MPGVYNHEKRVQKGGASMPNQVPLEKLRKVCDPVTLGCETSREISILEKIIGQERASKSLKFGLGIKNVGFNIYVAGSPGTGRTTAVKRFLEEIAKGETAPDDWCYTYNFRNPYHPNAIRLPHGQAKVLQQEMQHLIEGAQRDIRDAFESDEYLAKKEEITKGFSQNRDEIIQRTNKLAEAEGFMLQASPIGLLTIPLRAGKPLREEEFAALSAEEKSEIDKKREALQAEIEVAIRHAKRIERGADEALATLDQDVAIFTISHPVSDLQEKYHDLPEVVEYLQAVREDILQNLTHFREKGEERPAPALRGAPVQARPLRRYEVNVLVDNSELEGAPVITESNPTYNNLFGRIEQEAQFGALVTDFTLVRGGTLHQANGGYLVLSAEELLRNALTWESLKRALANEEITIEDVTSRYGLITTKSLRPEPIPLDVKVMLIGNSEVYHLLRAYDEDFSELFKVKADFSTQMDRSEENIHDYTAFVCRICEEEQLHHLDSTALAKIIEHGSRLAEDQEKLSTRFRDLADIIREASYYADQSETALVNAGHIKKAIAERHYRSNLLQERITEMIVRETIMIDIEGERVGQVNGLSVLDLGDIAFGRPSRITASIGLGRGGLIDIERESKLGGPIHTKGVMIISGYLTQQYAHDKPLSLSARLVFEQSYSGVEGDSASSAELHALLSSLSGLPIQQGIAVTGSVNQNGGIQAIGGVNEKIEGFFEVCKCKGLTGRQGVIVPSSNTKNLLLKEDVVQAIADGLFHVWQVSHIDEGIEILTGKTAGAKRKDGTFKQGTVHQIVDERLRGMADTMRSFTREYL
jgi:lon-related putative ATP-dependent protease